MKSELFPSLPLSTWQPTRDTIQSYARLLGGIRRSLTPRQPHWGHVSLRVSAAGLTTTPVESGGLVFELVLELANHHLALYTNHGEQWRYPLRGQPALELYAALQPVLKHLGVDVAIDTSKLKASSPGEYGHAAVERYWRILSRLDAVFKQFQGELRQRMSPVQLWPHHFDLAVLWFSGRQVPGTDPENEEYADEQMNFGFSTGDGGIPDPYFYATAYPFPEGLLEAPLPRSVEWHTEGWKGATLMYQALVDSTSPRETLLGFLRSVQAAGAQRMLGSSKKL